LLGDPPRRGRAQATRKSSASNPEAQFMLKIRLRRMGNRNRPYYRVVVSDSRRVPTSSAVEEVGHYDPTAATGGLSIDAERVEHWVSRGAQLSPTVRKLLRRQAGAAS